MASNSFGNIFKILTWGESHGKAIGVVIDGCPAGLPIDESEINDALSLRSPGRHVLTSPRKELDQAQILSGVFEGVTTGAPISIIIFNTDVDSTKYTPVKDLLRPGHANFTYLNKYGIFDYRGGGRSSARETACRVAAGAVAKKLLFKDAIQIVAYLSQVGEIKAEIQKDKSIDEIRKLCSQNSIFCPDQNASAQIADLIEKTRSLGDSLGGAITFVAEGLPVGLGDPVYEKLEANLACAMMSLPATKGFEIGSGFEAVQIRGSEHNDAFIFQENKIQTSSNFAGGTLGGISTGMPLIGRTVFKPTSSIMRSQKTVSTKGEPAQIELPQGSRHDPCVAIRAVPIVEAMVALVLADALLMNRSAKM